MELANTFEKQLGGSGNIEAKKKLKNGGKYNSEKRRS